MGALVQNSAAVTFQGVTATITHISYWSALTGGTFYVSDQLTTAQAVPARFEVDNLLLRVPDSTGVSNASDIIGLNARAAAMTHVQAHSGDPGTAGTANIITGLSRQAVSWKTAAGE